MINKNYIKRGGGYEEDGVVYGVAREGVAVLAELVEELRSYGLLLRPFFRLKVIGEIEKVIVLKEAEVEKVTDEIGVEDVDVARRLELDLFEEAEDRRVHRRFLHIYEL